MKKLLFVLLGGACLHANAAGYVENRRVYATNPNNQFGQEKTITVDGDPSDWTADMMIAQGGANDMCTTFYGQHENCVRDCYSLYAAWDDANLYLAWQMVNVADVRDDVRDGDGPLSDGGRIGEAPLQVALSIDPKKTMTGRVKGGGKLWDKCDVVYETPVDRILMMHGKDDFQGGNAMFLPADEQGNIEYNGPYQKDFASNGITLKMGFTFCGDQLLYLCNPQSPDDVYSPTSTWVNLLDSKSYKGYVNKAHNKTYDTFCEMKIPFAALGIDKEYIKTNGIGAMVVATRGESGIDCIPHDPCMLDNVYGTYAYDPSTSHEKDDSDTIRCQLADIGCRRAGSAPAPAPQAIVSIAQDYTFHADALMLSVRLKNASEGSYTIGNGSPVAFTGNTAFAIGDGLPVGESVTVNVTAKNGTETDSQTYTYTKGEGFHVSEGTALLLNTDWEECMCYMNQGGEKQNAKWPGVKMTEIGKGFHACTMPKGWTSANVIFNNGKEDPDKVQYPGAGGLALGNREVKLWDRVRWYDVANSTPTGISETTDGNTAGIRKVVHNGQVYIVLPTGEMYTIGGERL